MQRLKDEGNETVTNCHALKMMAIAKNDIVAGKKAAECLFFVRKSVPLQRKVVGKSVIQL